MKRKTVRRLIVWFLILAPSIGYNYLSKGEDSFGFLYIFLSLLVYFTPCLIGANKKNYLAIFWLTILAGWTFVGYVVAFVWSLKKD